MRAGKRVKAEAATSVRLPAPRWIWLTSGVVLAAWFHFAYLLQSAGTSADETWMVQVVGRMGAGETLYRDTFCGTTPLAFYIQWALAAVFGNDVWLLRVVVHLLFAANILMTAVIGHRLHVPGVWVLVAVAGLAVWMRPVPNSSYSALALLLLLGTVFCAAALETTARRDTLSLVAGSLAGLAFATKYNIGTMALVCFLAALAVFRFQGWMRQGAIAVAGFLAAALLPLAEVWRSGAWPWFVSQCFLGKAVYLKVGGVAYLDQLKWAPVTLLYLLPLCLPVLVLQAWRKQDEDARRKVLLVVFALASLACVYPRPDAPHMVLAAPALALAAVCWLSSLEWGRERRMLVAVLACLGALGDYGHRAAQEEQNGPYQRATLGPLRGVSLPEAEAEALRLSSRMLMASSGGESMLLLHQYASLFYLATGLQNPTRYDFPLATPFGPDGQREVSEKIRRGEIRAVCLDTGPWAMLPPKELIASVRAEMRGGPQAGPCRLFTR